MSEHKQSMLTLTAIGIVFGDIGTSPLYTLKTVFALAGGSVDATSALGLLSLIVWTLIITTSVKYILFVMRVDNAGEGGILALMSVLGAKKHHRRVIIAIGLFGAALIYGDGAITPAISVLSAVEGLKIAEPSLAPYVLPACVGILLVLFSLQFEGTSRIGWFFGPIMVLWFVVIGGLGLWGVVQHPEVLRAANPSYGMTYLFNNGVTGFKVLGGVFLCVTGAEALYADMGQVGAPAIRLAWYILVLPALLLSYAGQTSVVMDGGSTADNVFYSLCPKVLLMPLVALATAATIIASQAIITGAFSMTRQAIHLGWLPPLQITQTSSQTSGQIYISSINWLLMAATIGLTIVFQTSDNLASAYGIAVSLTMLLTTLLLFTAMREIWHWNIVLSSLVAGTFFIIDFVFFDANIVKIWSGGWVPLLFAIGIFASMQTWHRGARAVAEIIISLTEPVPEFMAKLTAQGIARVPGTAVFLTRTTAGTPPALIWHIKNNRSLHKKLIALTIATADVPRVKPSERVRVEKLAPHFWRVVAHYGYMEKHKIPLILKQASQLGADIDLEDMTYYVGRETVLPRQDSKGMPLWQERFYALMQRNTAHVGEFFSLPRERVVEIGRRFEI